jgi:hypothetical protein
MSHLPRGILSEISNPNIPFKAGTINSIERKICAWYFLVKEKWKPHATHVSAWHSTTGCGIDDLKLQSSCGKTGATRVFLKTSFIL